MVLSVPQPTSSQPTSAASSVDRLRGRLSAEPLLHFIGGEWCASQSGETFEIHTPTDNSLLAHAASGDAADIDRAAQAAHAAFPAWRALSGKARRRLLYRVAELIEARADEIAVAESYDTGQPIRFMKSAAIRAAENFRFFADRAEGAQDGLSLPAEGFLNYTLRQPVGPVGVITPWNTPFMLSSWKIAPALAAGCTVVHKPAEWSPVTAGLLAEIMHEAGLPAGVINLVHGYGETAGRALTEHPLIRAIAFIGESRTGSLIQKQGADTLKRVHLELGGKNPVVVFADADLERALDAAIFMLYSLNGQRCTSSSRLLIEAGIHDAFVEKLAGRVANLRVGDPLDPATEVGPLIHPQQFEKVCSYFDVARSEGATVAVGGGRLGTVGNYVRPTLFTHATNDMRIAQEEIFGPVLTVLRFADEADALKIANDVPYGLAAYLWTNDLSRAHRFAAGLEVGMVWINSENVRHLPTPFGGMKASGTGRDGGDYSFDFYMDTKNVALSLGTNRAPQLGLPPSSPKEE